MLAAINVCLRGLRILQPLKLRITSVCCKLASAWVTGGHLRPLNAATQLHAALVAKHYAQSLMVYTSFSPVPMHQQIFECHSVTASRWHTLHLALRRLACVVLGGFLWAIPPDSKAV